VRNRIRVLTAVLGVTLAFGAFASPAFAATRHAQEAATTSEENYKDEFTEECAHELAEGGSVDDCQKAPNPLVPELNEIIWGSLAFLVLLVAMWKWGVPAVKNMEAQREDRIRNDLESAERAKAEALAEKATYDASLADSPNEAARIVEEARVSAEAVRRDLIAKAEQEATEIRQRASADISNQTAQAMAELRGEVATLALDLAGRIVEKNLDDDTNHQLVNSFIDQVGRN
jgi:F-type H+-transporting ATPase subunit b